MEVLNDSSGNLVWLFLGAEAYTMQTISIAMGPINEPYLGNTYNPNQTGYYWVPLPVQIDLSTAFASWTDWLDWDKDNAQLWWGKDITISESGEPGLQDHNGQNYCFYYQTF
jgi:hypothetical protein